jgi:hypothetical protein
MGKYDKVYQLLFPLEVGQVADGTIALPDRSLNAPFNSSGFPPVLIPIVSVSTEYYGFWKHWFVPRNTSVVQVMLEERIYASEVARNFEQYAVIQALNCISWSLGQEARAKKFLAEVQMPTAFAEVKQFCKKSGDDKYALKDHTLFKGNVPLACCANEADYQGDFPTLAAASDPKKLRSFCSTEMSLEQLAAAVATPQCPPWLVAAFNGDPQAPVFEKLFDAGDLPGCWMCVNSANWNLAELTQALTNLQAAANDAAFATLVDAWLSVEQFGY